ncbi:MAG TPA: aminotransferase class IV [Candidatus Thermoplasmatota archaeon]|nr:aminotransferase class IV [Candidatus Thermoplasmatota archaeon]
MSVVHWNGRLVPEGEVRVSPFDRGLLLGDAVFETLRAYDGRPFNLDGHLARLAASCAHARLPFPEGLPEAVRATIDANGLAGADAAVRITVTRGPGGRGASPKGAGPPTVLVTATPVAVPPWTYERGLRLATARRRKTPAASLDPAVKSTNYLVHVLARAEAEEAGADDALFLDEDDLVVEATQANVLAVTRGRLETPPLSSGCLPGETRAILLRLAPQAGLEARERALCVTDLLEADEVLLCASVTEVAPAVELDGVALGGGKPGPWARALHGLYRKHARDRT